MSCIAIIPGRGGSRRIPGKNIKDFHGKPIIAYSIKIAQESGLFDRIVVSTDDDEIAGIARQYGVEVHHRSAEQAQDEVGTQEVMGQVLRDLGVRGDYACCIYSTSPLMRVEDLRKGYARLKGYRTDFALSVGYPPLRDAGQFYWGTTEAFTRKLPLIGQHTKLILVPPEHVCDINTPEDWALAEIMYERLQKSTTPA